MEKGHENHFGEENTCDLSVSKNEYSDNSCNGNASCRLEEIQLESNQSSALPLSNNFSDIDLSTCSNVQVGTRIITSNLTVVDQNNSIIGALEKPVKFNSNSKDLSEDNDVCCQIACKTYFEKIWKKCIFVIILTFILSCIVIELPHSNLVNHQNTDHDDDLVLTTTLRQIDLENTASTFIHNGTWYITRQEWGARPARKCNEKLNVTNQIKIMMRHKLCSSFSVCCETMRDWQNELLKYNHPDLFYHFGISEDGMIYEGLSTECQTRPAYRDCNESVFVVMIYYGSNVCLDSDLVKKQVESFNKIITHNMNKGVLSKDFLTINLYKACVDRYLLELNKTYSDIRVYSIDRKDSC